MNPDNKYLSPLNITERALGSWSVEKYTEPSGKEFQTASAQCVIFGGQSRKIVCWDRPTHWHRLIEKGSIWMSDQPCEIAQHFKGLHGLCGHVLVGGLGLGLATTMLARRKSVSKITVVEKSPEVCELVFPCLKNKSKLNLITEDLFNFIQHTSQTFDSAFYDIWAGDGELAFLQYVLPLLNLSKSKVIGKVGCWNEDVMRGQLALNLLSKCYLYETRPQEVKKAFNAVGEDHPLVGWQVPFINWLFETKPNLSEAQAFASYYASNLGRLSLV